jgi:hypothetical protein
MNFVGSPPTPAKRQEHRITVKSLLARRGSFILKRYPHWTRWSGSGAIRPSRSPKTRRSSPPNHGSPRRFVRLLADELRRIEREKTRGKLKVYTGGKGEAK